MGDPEPCSEVHEGKLTICTYNCASSAISDTDIDLVRNIAVVTGRLSVIRTDLLDLRAFECLEEADGIVVNENANLESLAGLNNVRRIGREEEVNDGDWKGIGISRNPRLASLDGLDAVREIPAVEINSNDSLASLSLNHVAHIGRLTLGDCGRNSPSDEAVGLGDNPSLTALDGFDSLISLETLSVSGQSNLTSIDRLTELAQRGVQFTEVELKVNERLERADIDAFMNAAGVTGTVCGNAGGDAPCMCSGIGPEPCVCPWPE